MRAADGKVRPHFGPIAEWLAQTPAKRVAEKRREADLLFHRVGITFAVYGDAHGAEQGAERLIPFDTIPRIIPQAEWDQLAKGLKQRVDALNRFLHDIYHGQEILKAGAIPPEQVLKNAGYQKEMHGVELVPLRFGDDSRNGVERNQPLGALLGAMRVAVDREGDAHAMEQQVRLAAFLSDPLGGGIGQPLGDRAEMRAHLALGRAHFIVLSAAFHAKILSGTSKTRASKP